MSHFSPAEFVDAAEGRLASLRLAHLESCVRCATQIRSVQAALGAAHDNRDGGVSEPSPLYWDHLSARIRAGVAAERIEPWWRGAWPDGFGMRGIVRVASTAVLLIALLAGGVMMKGKRSAVFAPPLDSAPPALDVSPPVEDSEAWLVLTSAAADMPLDEAHAAGMGVPAGAVDRAVQRLSPAELDELGRLLKSELRGSN
jgi:hypothetical protein